MMQPEKEFEVFWEKERLEWPTSMAENPMLKDAVYAGWKAGKSSEASDESLTCEDVSQLRSALSWMGYSTPESLEECGVRHKSLIRNLIRAVLKHKQMKSDFFSDCSSEEISNFKKQNNIIASWQAEYKELVAVKDSLLSVISEAENIAVESISRMRTAHVGCADLTRRAESLLQAIKKAKGE